MNECRYEFMHTDVGINLSVSLNASMNRYLNISVCINLLMNPGGMKI